MIRLFETHKVRKITELEGIWDFTPLKDTFSGDVSNISYGYSLPVPGCWEMHPDFLTYVGKGAYRKSITVNRKTSMQLTFKGVSHTADIYFDGNKITHHYNAYTPFSVVLKDVEQGSHEIVVVADNSFSEASALHIPNDYYSYGGIIRPVVVEEIPDIFIQRIKFTPFKDKGQWKGKIDVVIGNLGGKEEEVAIKGSLGENNLDLGRTCCKPGERTIVTREISVNQVSPWSNKTPQLYMLELQLFRGGTVLEEGNVIDDYIDRVGFRTVKVEKGRIIVNGEEVFLKGFNRHEDHALAGSAIPFQLMVKDMELMKDMGANAVRTSHYPNDERFLDLCDESGIYVWEENHARGLSLEQMKNPNFDRQCEDCNHEMVENHFNHPSIIIWGILNECASHTEEGRECYRKQFEQIRNLDQSRPLTFATCQHFKDICMDLPDIVSLNLYPKWYSDEDISESFSRESKWLDEVGGEDKPIIVSEFGAGAIYGYRDPSRVKWTEERQADILDESLSVYMKEDKVMGVFIWQFCDCRVSEDGRWPMVRPRTKNNKGIVDEYRRPKLAYNVVQKHFKR